MAETSLERLESIDMLRLLENGHAVRLVETARETYPVDTPADQDKLNAMMVDDNLLSECGEVE